jgi:hypothetical protein
MRQSTDKRHGAVVLPFVPRSPPQPRMDVRISATLPGYPLGRSRLFRLTGCDLAVLIESAERLEGARNVQG